MDEESVRLAIKLQIYCLAQTANSFGDVLSIVPVVLCFLQYTLC